MNRMGVTAEEEEEEASGKLLRLTLRPLRAGVLLLGLSAGVPGAWCTGRGRSASLANWEAVSFSPWHDKYWCISWRSCDLEKVMFDFATTDAL